jgi:16S rRNA (guanine966-N2)-methyltransferase
MPKPPRRRAEPLTEATELRIVGGRFRGRKLRHEPFRDGDDLLVTRPMKHRLRETIFNLVSIGAQGRHAIDLFAGTGALGLEALSRGSSHATFIERHVPTARVIEENIRSLGVEEQTTLLTTSAFLWGKRDIARAESGRGKAEVSNVNESPTAFPPPPSAFPWLVFCSPPYDFFVDRQDDMLGLIKSVMRAAPPSSIVVVEADERFDFTSLPVGDRAEGWDVRPYAPAVVGVWWKAATPE